MTTVSPNLSKDQNIQFILFRLASNLFSMGLTLGSIRIILDVIGGVETKIENLLADLKSLMIKNNLSLEDLTEKYNY